MRNEKIYYVYIMASGKNGTLYIGVTNNLIRRVKEHKNGTFDGFTKKYGINVLVYSESFGEIGMALYREKQLKNWRRGWKLALIEKDNPSWKDLFVDFLDTGAGFLGPESSSG